MRDVICNYHDIDGDLRGMKLTDPQLNCPSCRQANVFTKEQIAEYHRKEAEYELTGGTIVKKHGAEMRIIDVGDTTSAYARRYKVFLNKGRWPSTDEIVHMCYGEAPPFGHTVVTKDKVAEVTCYRD